jgi:TatD DNase family protein
MDSLMQNAKKLGVEYFLNVATEPTDWAPVLNFAKKYPNVFASVGLHPSEACEKEPDEEIFLQWAVDDKIIAIGETGLDYYHKEISPKIQEDRFRCQIRVARALKKPLIIHTREAQKDTLRILREEQAAEIGGVMHCFTESWEMAKAAMDLNFRISFSGIVTFKKAIELKEVALKVPLDYMLVETDAPFLTPEPYRGKPNEPAYVYHVAQYLSQWRKQSFETIAAETTHNFFQLFKEGTHYALHQEK